MTVPPASPESLTPAEIAAAVMAAQCERQPQLSEFGSFVTPRSLFREKAMGGGSQVKVKPRYFLFAWKGAHLRSATSRKYDG